ncbi:MAG: esterase family protein [Gemmatimonas sp.]|nr:alpha/beta hydrolase-fold protein [Gemmatimonadaceae bacterium]
MHREHRRWKSPSLGRDMDLLIFGHAGARVLVFPTSMGRFFEWEDRGMIGALGEHLAKGWLQLYCVDSVDDESWYATHIHPADRARRHEAYERYLLHEVLPLSRHLNDNAFLITTGASFGAYHAMSFALRHPEITGRVVGMSGLYDIKQQTGGFSDDSVYFNNPADFLRNEHDPGRLAAIRRVDIIFAIGRDDPMHWSNEMFSRTLWGKGIPHAFRVWDGWAHDWPWWERMVRMYIGGSD